MTKIWRGGGVCRTAQGYVKHSSHISEKVPYHCIDDLSVQFGASWP